MDEKLQLRIRWPDGTILPIITQQSASIGDIIKMLRFACGPKQELSIFYNNDQLDPEAGLVSYDIKDGDTLQALIKTVQPNQQRIFNSIDNITREAAKISDMHMNRIEDQSSYYAMGMIEEEITEIFTPVDRTVIPPKGEQMNTTPLPSPWKDRTEEREGSHGFDSQMEQPRFSTREEAQAFFSSDGRDRWMW